jgi:NADPH2:quinone reductase
MSKAIRFHTSGGAEVLSWEEVPVAPPAAHEAQVRHTAVGLNFIDVYHRSGVYPVAALPSGIGLEAAGVVEALGADATGLAVGDRVAYASPPLGAYSEVRCIAADRLVKLPDDIDDQTAAAMMLQGMTAQYLLRQTYRVKAGDTVLMHAAAGGVGLVLCQWAKHLGATVIGTVGNDEKAALALDHGCDHTIVYTREDFGVRVRELTDGNGVQVVYDGIGKDTFFGSLDCLTRRGMMVSFGNASGQAPAITPAELGKRGSLFLTRPSLMDYTVTRAETERAATDLFEVVQAGAVSINIKQTYPLANAADAHRDLEARKTVGSTVLLP